MTIAEPRQCVPVSGERKELGLKRQDVSKATVAAVLKASLPNQSCRTPSKQQDRLSVGPVTF
jgi:hypothetical protein